MGLVTVVLKLLSYSGIKHRRTDIRKSEKQLRLALVFTNKSKTGAQHNRLKYASTLKTGLNYRLSDTLARDLETQL